MTSTCKTSEMQNPSWFLYGPGSASIQDISIPTIKNDHDVLVRIRYIGVCGSDVHFWRHGGIGLKVDSDQPLVVGHEASGTVAAVGSAVKSLKVDDKVAIEPGFPCRRCTFCKDGFYNLCPDVRFAAAPPDVHGCLTKYWIAPEDFLYKLPDDIGLAEAVLLEPNRSGSPCCSFGENQVRAKCVGLLCGAVSKAFGAERVIMVDISKEKLDFAKTFLDCETFLTDLNTTGEVTAVSILETFGILGGVDAVIEASGAELSVHTGIFVLKSGGSYVQTGIGKPKIEFPILALSEKELRIRGCFRYSSGDYVLALTLFSQGHIKHRELISSISPFEDAILAWEKTGKGQGIKNLIEGVRDA